MKLWTTARKMTFSHLTRIERNMKKNFLMCTHDDIKVDLFSLELSPNQLNWGKARLEIYIWNKILENEIMDKRSKTKLMNQHHKIGRNV